MSSDAFRYVWMRSEISEIFWKFSGEDLYSVDDSERVQRFLEVFGRVWMHSDAFGCVRKQMEGFGKQELNSLDFLRLFLHVFAWFLWVVWITFRK